MVTRQRLSADGGSGIGNTMFLPSLLAMLQASSTGTPTAPSSVSSSTPASPSTRIGLGSTTQGWSNGLGLGTWLNALFNPPASPPSQASTSQTPTSNTSGTPNSNSVAAGGPWQSQNPSGWFPGQGQGFTFFGQTTPQQVGTNEYAWGTPTTTNPTVPGTNPSATSLPTNQTSTSAPAQQSINISDLMQYLTNQGNAFSVPNAYGGNVTGTEQNYLTPSGAVIDYVSGNPYWNGGGVWANPATGWNSGVMSDTSGLQSLYAQFPNLFQSPSTSTSSSGGNATNPVVGTSLGGGNI